MNREESIIFAQKFLEDMLSFYGLNLAIHSSYEDDIIQLSVPSSELNSILIGHNAGNLRSIQQIIASALQIKGAELSRVNVDIADYKKQRADRIAAKAEVWIEKVRKYGDDLKINLNAADRRIVHKVAKDYSDVQTRSEGEGRDRYIIISRKLIK